MSHCTTVTVVSCFSSNPHFQTALLSSYTLCTTGVVPNFEPLPNYLLLVINYWGSKSSTTPAVSDSLFKHWPSALCRVKVQLT